MKSAKLRPPFQTKSRVFSRDGLAVTGHPLATLESARVLMEGGNAFDAAITAAAVTNVTLPASCGLGGDVYAVAYSARDGAFYAFIGSGIGQRVTLEDMLAWGHKKMPVKGPLSIALPGAVGVYEAMLNRFAVLPLSRLFEPAIRHARQGFPLSELCAFKLGAVRAKVAEDADAAALYLNPDLSAPAAGQTLVLKNLASSFEHLVKYGLRDFYEGYLAARMLGALKAKGVRFEAEDFAAHETEVASPLRVDYRGHTLLTTPPPSQGMILLQEMKILEAMPLAEYGHNSAKAIHCMVEAKKLAFASRIKYAGDPRHISIPWDSILSDGAVSALRGKIDADKAMTKEAFMNLLEEKDGDTTTFCIADKDGNAVSFVHSLSNRMGSGVVAGDTGILMNNRAGRGFTLLPGHPNCVAPGKRTMHTLVPYMTAVGGRPRIVGNTFGGDNQPQWNMQVLANLIDFNLNEEQAVTAPRWFSYPGTDPEHFDKPFSLTVEEGVSDEVCGELRRLGHNVERVGAWEGGGGHMLIHMREDGVMAGGCDPRCDGAALGC